MAAPTVSFDDSLKATMEEYGLTAADLGFGPADDEDAERALLARFLFEPPKRLAVSGERNGLTLDRVSKQLGAWLRMISGRTFNVAYSDPPATDNLNIYLPRAVPAPEQPESDLLLYRAMGLVQVGFIQHGIVKDRPVLGEIHRDWVLRSAYHLLAARYVLRKWSEQFPGIKADLARIPLHDKASRMRINLTEVPRDQVPGPFLPLYEGLAQSLNWRAPGPDADPARQAVLAVDRFEGAGVAGVLLGHAQRLREHFRRLRLGPPPLPFFVGIIRPEWILADLARDVAAEQEWRKGNKPLRQLLEAMGRNGASPAQAAPEPEPQRTGLRARLLNKLRGADTSNAPAYGALRDEHHDQAREIRYGAATWGSGSRPEEKGLAEGAVEKPGEDGSREYDEWDDKAGSFRMAAVKVKEIEAPVGGIDNYHAIVEANRRQIKQIRQRFEALRVEERWQHGVTDGTEIDLNRAITAIADIRAGQQPDDRIWARFVRERQTVAILTMVDLSGSTQGNVIAVEREALVMFSEGLRALGFPHAFYGFGNTHPAECHVQRIKGFDEPYGDVVHKRIGNLRPNGATRMGAYVRHGAWMLSQRAQARRVMLLVSDGRPEDRGEYRGTYGVKDTAMAVTEARRMGIHVHCISVDPSDDAEKYLAEIFGKGRYLRLKDVDSLPMRLPEVFRGLVR